MVGKAQSEKGPKVQVGARLDPGTIELWHEIDEREAVGNRAQVLEWCIESGYQHLRKLTDLRNQFGDQLIAQHGPRAVLSAHFAGAEWENEKPNLDSLQVEVRINGQEDDLIAGYLREVSSTEWQVIVTARKSNAFPELVLDTFDPSEPLVSVAEHLGNVPWLPLADGPGNGRPSKELIARRLHPPF